MITGQCTCWVLVGIQRNFSKNNNNYSLCSITIIPNLWNHASLGIEGAKKRVGGGGGGKTKTYQRNDANLVSGHPWILPATIKLFSWAKIDSQPL
jgi:hypothetical protein